MCRKVYPGQKPQIKIFGSLMTGLALESSDMDMAVTNLQIDDKSVLIEEMHKLADCLQEWDLVQDLRSIPTAQIPVIKANIDIQKLRDTEMKS